MNIMVKKSKRIIPSMMVNITGDGEVQIDVLCEQETFSGAVFYETVASIRDAVENKKETAILFELGETENYVEIPKNQWNQALNSCIDIFSANEKYEKCAEIKILIDKIK